MIEFDLTVILFKPIHHTHTPDKSFKERKVWCCPADTTQTCAIAVFQNYKARIRLSSSTYFTQHQAKVKSQCQVRTIIKGKIINVLQNIGVGDRKSFWRYSFSLRIGSSWIFLHFFEEWNDFLPTELQLASIFCTEYPTLQVKELASTNKTMSCWSFCRSISSLSWCEDCLTVIFMSR